jgi:hypothetical protein
MKNLEKGCFPDRFQSEYKDGGRNATQNYELLAEKRVQIASGIASIHPPCSQREMRTKTMREFDYPGWTLFKAIDALMAHDNGAFDSGVNDEALRSAVINFLGALDDAGRRKICAEFARGLLSDENIERGYGLEDVRNFMEWLDGIEVTAD